MISYGGHADPPNMEDLVYDFVQRVTGKPEARSVVGDCGGGWEQPGFLSSGAGVGLIILCICVCCWLRARQRAKTWALQNSAGDEDDSPSPAPTRGQTTVSSAPGPFDA